MIVIPFKPINPKSRLSDVLSEEERKKFAELMLIDVVNALKAHDSEIKVISTSRLDLNLEVEFVEDQRELDECINSELKEVPKAIVMSDLPLLNSETFERFLSSEGDIVIAPGRKGGTNMLLVRRKGFRVSYHYCSFLKHIDIARNLGFNFRVFDSFYSSIDIDDESDLLELMIHGEGKLSKTYLEKLGFRIKFDKIPTLIRV
ncbi:MAG: 2-phospho-L-lactate/phosphoenolpyruvate guanylyltransferase [Archaeoglobaceae archaeon]|nr:2-phospho-L-lactate/phosphoenolpyruvate guanylyltransferase [Archaeoglobaceae archaeon]MDK2876143.1 2-phospho-L-lactate/phosphoenolpyruvate guanylyltransferase [Archaeoglobaceae archaeon]